MADEGVGGTKTSIRFVEGVGARLAPLCRTLLRCVHPDIAMTRRRRHNPSSPVAFPLLEISADFVSGAKPAAAPAVIVQAAMCVSSLGLEVGEVGCRDSSVVADFVPTRRPTVHFGMSAWRCRSPLEGSQRRWSLSGVSNSSAHLAVHWFLSLDNFGDPLMLFAS